MGRPKLIKDPNILWEWFLKYRDWAKSTPILKQEQRKGVVVIPRGMNKEDFEVPTIINIELERPLTIEGYMNWVYNNGKIMKDIGNVFYNTGGGYDKYSSICQRIKAAIRQDQIEGGMAGIYNPSITQRLNNLVEKVQEDGDKKVTINVRYEKKGYNLTGAAPRAIKDIEPQEEV